MRRGILSIGRKNGKTVLLAALVLVHLIGPEGEQNGEIVSAARNKDQAGEIFKYCKQMIELEPRLKARIGVIEGKARLVCYGNGTFYQAITRDAKSKHGGNPSLIIYDELAQVDDRQLYDVLDTSQGARREPLFLSISTQSPDPQHIFSQLVDDALSGRDETVVCHLYAVPDDQHNIFDPRCWHKANPGLGDFRTLEDFEALARKAQRMASFEPTFRNLYLNQRVSSAAPMIANKDWAACRKRLTIEPGATIFAGLDLSMNADLTSLVAITDGDTDKVLPYFWKPGELIDEHTQRDHRPYDEWTSAGYIEATPGRIVDYGCVAERLAQLNADFNLAGVAYDRWRIEYLLKELDERGIDAWIEGKTDEIPGAIRLVPWSQSFANMGPAVDALEESVINRTLEHDNNPVLTWNLQNAFVIHDAEGNRKIDKRKTRFRIDGAVALVIASGFKARDSAKDREDKGIEVPADYRM